LAATFWCICLSGVGCSCRSMSMTLSKSHSLHCWRACLQKRQRLQNQTNSRSLCSFGRWRRQMKINIHQYFNSHRTTSHTSNRKMVHDGIDSAELKWTANSYRAQVWHLEIFLSLCVKNN
jgi:hypothetical protein